MDLCADRGHGADRNLDGIQRGGGMTDGNDD